MEEAKALFDKMPFRDSITWSALIAGYLHSEQVDRKYEVLDVMLMFGEVTNRFTFSSLICACAGIASSIVPNDLVLLAVLSACAHSGLVDRDLQHFNSMESVYGVKPGTTHYNCIVDMLSRAWRLSEAEEFIKSMPFEPDANAWAALLNGCKFYKNEDLAKTTANKVCELAEEISTREYVVLSNIYASSGRWKDVEDVRKRMQEKGLKKNRGCGRVEIKNQVHSFYSGNASHPQSPAIYAMLELIRADKMEP